MTPRLYPFTLFPLHGDLFVAQNGDRDRPVTPTGRQIGTSEYLSPPRRRSAPAQIDPVEVLPNEVFPNEVLPVEVFPVR